ncbi:uncharacterized protein BX664DRAFT_383181 [Halteromyces radiatus]|uniref:uncharacterized protein n=1 Tax=Halteromyces radiatus TaxID=101107 RepID=UPI0022212611|nr:uncharacterized protein BX664DRAFT_383181 [Halteromyces radiatus]KAI8096790.1 hypothetical protein BX664DRAFT_383181 [Halteromyces radiatus]
MSIGLTGFRNAPVTKVLVTVIGSCSAISCLYEANHIPLHNSFWRTISSQWTFPSIGSAIVGTWLIYRLRIIERRYGSSKFAALAFISIVMSSLLHHVTGLTLGATSRSTLTGPYALIFAILYQYHLIVPSTYQVPVLMKITMTDKSYVYAAAAQLLLLQLPSSIVPSLYGLLSGVLYNFDGSNMKDWRFPSWLRSFASNYILPILGTTSPTPSSSNYLSRPSSNTIIGASSSTSYSSNHVRQRNTNQVDLPPSSENIDALLSMFPHCSRDVAANALISSRHDLNRAAETLLTTAPPPSSATEASSSSSPSTS